MYRGYQLLRSFVVQLSHPERLRFTIGDLEAVLADFGYGDTRAERPLPAPRRFPPPPARCSTDKACLLVRFSGVGAGIGARHRPGHLQHRVGSRGGCQQQIGANEQDLEVGCNVETSPRACRLLRPSDLSQHRWARLILAVPPWHRQYQLCYPELGPSDVSAICAGFGAMVTQRNILA